MNTVPSMTYNFFADAGKHYWKLIKYEFLHTRFINSLKMGMEKLIMHEMRNSSPVLYNAHGQGSQIP